MVTLGGENQADVVGASSNVDVRAILGQTVHVTAKVDCPVAIYTELDAALRELYALDLPSTGFAVVGKIDIAAP